MWSTRVRCPVFPAANPRMPGASFGRDAGGQNGVRSEFVGAAATPFPPTCLERAPASSYYTMLESRGWKSVEALAPPTDGWKRDKHGGRHGPPWRRDRSHN